MLLRVLLEGVGLGAILMLVCAVGIRNGAWGWSTSTTPMSRSAA